jgi:uncharacterized membrane protein YgcG
MDMSLQRKLGSVNCQGLAAEFSKLHIAQWALALLLAIVLLFAAYPQSLVAQEQPGPLRAPSGPPYQEQTPEQLQELVAPIALYPDSLVAQILAASTFPEQVVDADRWVQSHPDLKGDALGQAVDQLPWDPSVKALVAFPSVLGNMDKNLSWTSSLGDAYYNQEQDVMDAVQVMRRRAQEAGHLNSTPQQSVITEGSDIEIEPVGPEIIYVPAYDPWVVYGGPIAPWPGWYPYPGIWYDGPVIFFGAGFGVGYFGGYGWGWHHWGCDWHHHYAVHDHERYYSSSRTFYNRDRFYRGERDRGVYNDRTRQPSGGNRGGERGEEKTPQASGGDRERAQGDHNRAERTPQLSGRESEGARGVDNRPERTPQPFGGDRGAARGYAEPRGQSGVRSGAFSGFGPGGQERSFSSRGSASFGGGFHGGGGGGSHGGGGRH